MNTKSQQLKSEPEVGGLYSYEDSIARAPIYFIVVEILEIDQALLRLKLDTSSPRRGSYKLKILVISNITDEATVRTWFVAHDTWATFVTRMR